MNKSASIRPGEIEQEPFDPNGEPAWTPEMQARMDAIRRSPEYLAGVEQLNRLNPNDEGFTTEQLKAWRVERKREWRAARGL